MRFSVREEGLSLSTFLQILLAVAGIGMVSLLVSRAIRAYHRYRGKMLVTCPENLQTVAVEIDLGGARGHRC